ncbi:MAG: flagellar motor protein MotB [Leptospirillia bacterium]
MNFVRTARGQAPDLVDTWMVTFTDLLTLLVTLFVLFISMSSIRQGLVQDGTNPEWEVDGTRVTESEGAVAGRMPSDVHTLRVGEEGARMEQFRTGLARAGVFGGFHLTYDDRGLVLVPGAALLAGADADGNDQLAALAAFVNESGRSFEVSAVASEAGSWQSAEATAKRIAALLVAVGVEPDGVVPVARLVPLTESVDGETIEGGIELIFAD